LTGSIIIHGLRVFGSAIAFLNIGAALPWMPASQLAAPFQWPIKDNYGSNFENSCVQISITRIIGTLRLVRARSLYIGEWG
jgi:hypothetical protein